MADRPELLWHPMVLRTLGVQRVCELTPRMRRVTLAGPELGTFVRDGRELPAFRTLSHDDHVQVFFPAPGESRAVLPGQGDGVLEWPDQPPRPIHRDYTPRRFDPGAGELDLDLVVHGEGPASAWAESVRVGDSLSIAGPHSSAIVPPAEWYLLAGDETALPAIARWLDVAPSSVRADVVVEVADPAERQSLPDWVTWVFRDAGGSLASAVRALEWRADDVSAVFAWAAGEAGAVRDIRRYLSRERALPRTRMSVNGYWRR